jgi:hypothetical protein
MRSSRAKEYKTITGRRLSLEGLSLQERNFLARVNTEYQDRPGWSEFGKWWARQLDKEGFVETSLVYRICQDLEARLGIEQGKVAPPDYRDYLADLIDEKYGTRYRFCKEVGVDPGHLSRVFASRSDLSLQALSEILNKLHAVLVVEPQDDLREAISAAAASRTLASVVS